MLSLAAAMLFTLTISAQTTISGHVKDDTGEDIIGASIVVKGTQGGTVTDFDGNFKVQCKPGTTLVITYVGFVPQEVKAQDGMDITLKEDVAQLNEVVVVGYGSLAKKEISSSVVQINKDQFNQGAASDPMALVAGKVAGLNVSTSADANPNAMTDIQVRGAGSLSASNGPLVVIDGIAGGDLRNIATQDVESITVLKDAGSAAIYGTRGANGVILVTTKKGSGTAGVTNVTYDSYIALNFQKGKPDILSTDEYRRSRRGPDYGGDPTILIGLEAHRDAFNVVGGEEDAVTYARIVCRQGERRITHGLKFSGAAQLRTVELDHCEIALACIVLNVKVDQRIVDSVVAVVRIRCGFG